jgi:hypothetical protein
MQNWRLVHLAGGFLDMSARTSLILDLKARPLCFVHCIAHSVTFLLLQAHQDWSVGYDKTFPVIPQNAVIDINVGPLPFRITFEVPLRITGASLSQPFPAKISPPPDVFAAADATFHAVAEATAGANAQWNFGDMYAHLCFAHHRAVSAIDCRIIK